MVERGLDDERHPLLREDVRARHVARGRHGEEDGGEVRDERLEERVASRRDLWGNCGVGGGRLVLVEVRGDGVVQGFTDLQPREPDLLGITGTRGVLTEGMSYCTDSASASSACGERRNASGCAGNNASTRLFTRACIDGKSSCWLDDTLNKAANLSNEVESSRILWWGPESDQWVDICAERGSHIMVEVLEQVLHS